MLNILINILLPVFIVAGISAVAEQKLRLDVQTFSKAAFYVFSPAMVIDALLNSDISGGEFGQIGVTVVVTMLVLWGVGELLAHLLQLPPGTQAAFLVSLILANTGNYGLPVNLFAFGESGVARAALVVTVNSLMRSSLGVYLAARGTAASLRQSVREVFSVPVIYAAAVGVGFSLVGWTLPEPVLKAAHILGQGLVPASLAVLGAQIVRTLREQRTMTNKGALAAMTLGRLVLAPILAYLIGGLFGLNGLARKVVTLEMATPSAVMALVLATEFETDIPFAAMAILATTLVSLITVTIWLSWLI
jgi:hypothetical protein